ncbi:hypothetical protein P3X46_019156 [Hevea brasiliensis]|uniref:tRNA/rRNA methyltransferase SpoU type domain-containing protein n=1 Tax=Hevea brasiliensis TaxID=3981 RepID=A0ABQ9LU81_HEVBR|nr:uncharacterized protein LOC131169304 isoform X2 [Hevea brasiliensis]KAJ9171108.1 hypothetical protein P3X46_019156 [Hevea brasiliensis]
MQSTYAYRAPAVSPPHLNLSNSKPRLSIASPNQPQTQTQKISQYRYYNSDGDIDNSAEVKFTLPAHVKSITSTSNPFVKHCVKLRHSSSYRHFHGSALVVGTTPIREICEFQKSSEERTVEMECLILLDKAKIPEGFNNSTRTLRVSALVMKKLSQLQSTESIEAIALMRFPTSYFVVGNHQKDADCRKWFPAPHRILVLEGIQDPGNLGTLVRSAVAFRWGGIFLLPGCCDPFNDKALKASRGASFQVPIVAGSWQHLEALKHEFQMQLLAGHPASNDELKPVSQLSQGLADSLADVPLCLVLGSEGHGLSEQSLRECELVSIPMARNYESLNVAVAGGIFLYMLQP